MTAAPTSPGAARLSVLREAFRTSLWPLPALGVLLAVALGVVLPRLEARGDALPAAVTTYLFEGGPGAARTVLQAVAGSLITVTSLTFSLTVVTLQLASSQFSPRLLRTFTRDRFVHTTLALFLATFTYALTVLRTVRSPADGTTPFVPQLSVTVAFVLTLGSVMGLVLFLAHLATAIRVETMLRTVHTDASDTVGRVLDRPDGSGGAAPVLAPSSRRWLVEAASSGFLVGLDEQALLAAAEAAGAVVRVERYPGSSVVAGTPVAVAWALDDAPFAEPVVERLRDQVARALHAGPERTAGQDIGFGLRQLTDVAVKALSPGVNDPTTAVHALGHVSALLCELAGYDLGPRLLHDDRARVRVVLCRPSFEEVLELAVGQPRRYGAADPFVLARLFSLLQEVAWSVRRPEQGAAVAGQLDRLRGTALAQDADATERERYGVLARQVEQALSGSWSAQGRAW